MPLTAALHKGEEQVRLIHGMDLSIFPFLLCYILIFSALLYCVRDVWWCVVRRHACIDKCSSMFLCSAWSMIIFRLSGALMEYTQ